MSELPDEIQGTVSNWYDTRTVRSATSEILGEAQSLSIGVISEVNRALENMAESGNSALNEAIEAVNALGKFSPHAINVSYSPPGFEAPGFLEPGKFTATDSGGDLTTPDTGTVTLPITTPEPPIIGGTSPVAGDVAFGAPPPLQVFFAPPTPTLGGIKELGEPPPVVFTEFTAEMPIPPALRELVLPTFTPQPFPDYVDPFVQPLPPVPGTPNISLDELVDYVRLWGDEVIKAAPNLGGVLIRDLVTHRDVRNAVETWRIRGCPLDNEQERAQVGYADELTRLMNQAESRQLIIDEGLNGAEVGRTQLRFAVQFQVMFLELTVAVAKVYFEAASAQAQALLSLAKSMTLYYNAITAQYAADAMVYKMHIEEEVARMKYWQALVSGEVAKTKANEQMAKLYVQTEQVETIEADVYAAQVGAVMAQVERYKAEIEALVAKAEVAKTSIAVYRGQTDAYAAGVAAYKAHFDAYQATARGVSAQNQAQQQASELSLAEATRVSAEAGIISTNIDVAAEQLKAQAMKISSSYESSKMTNIVEANRAQIQGNSGRIKAMTYGADQVLKEVQNEHAMAFAQQATRYYTAASDSAYRASEQTLKAITAATQAAAIAQEAAGRSSASLSQGALSAVHISASLSGSGRLSGSETHSADASQRISDMITYAESKTETLSA